MSPLWVLPLVVVALGAVALAAAARRVAAELVELQRSAAGLRQLAAEAEAARLDVDAARRRGAELGDLRGRIRALQPSVSDLGQRPAGR